uniref:Putative secreted protein n=1 Tax=Psorophora albipes TaxID=869069 RepID=T1E2S1_9DIPT
MSLRIIIIKLLRFGGGIEAAVAPAGVVISTTGVAPLQTLLRSLECNGIHGARWFSGPATLLGDSRIFTTEPTRTDDLGLEANIYEGNEIRRA